ncbi:ATP-dependent DNA helicase Q-like SIM isoform X2 [Diospyros lotus]|nr:ATP-dependent DNA helicase Q-like SIM isoform X2 [Diospyros lotus]
MRQSTIVEHLQCAGRLKRKKTHLSVSRSQVLPKPAKGSNEVFHAMESNMETTPETFMLPPSCQEEVGIGPGWEHKVNDLLQKRFGYSSLKQFQKDALAAWLAHQDCLVLAATGSGKSLCFQIPALLSGKVVVVISPLISLMYDQCVKLAKHGVSACFLGSGQPDSSIEKKAMRGMYDIIYVCPETILRLIKPLQGLAESRGIALFAIDEVHCISKWGHDFRPDYRRLSVLRENFRADGLKFLRFDIPLMALTATATLHVREDILKSLCMSSDTKIVLTSFFRPNLQFSVQHSRTSSPSSYEKDFRELISIYSKKKMSDKKKHDAMLQELEYGSDSSSNTSKESLYKADTTSQSDLNNIEDDAFFENDDDGISLTKANWSTAPNEKKLSVEYLEDESDMLEGVDDLDVPCGEFFGQSLDKESNICGSSLIYDIPNKQGEGLELWEGHLEEGPTIIYVPTRKETLSIAKFLCKFGVRAAAYNAKLPKVQLRQVHMDFHENALEVVVATIAFGMGIDKLNVRRIIHYGWPQSLEAYYQEAGRAGRDGKLAHCILYADLSRIPSLLPSQRSKEQTEHAYKMLSDCFRYGMNTSSCRAKTLVEYFGETFSNEICKMCDVCVNGPPKMLNLKAEADVFMHVIAAHYGQVSSGGSSYDNVISVGNKQGRQLKPNIRMFVTKIREQFQKFLASDVLWWRGFSRILEDKGFIREVDDMIRVQIKFPEPTQQGLEFLQGKGEQPFYVYPEADMLLSQRNDKPYSSFSEWGKGWADPDIRRQRLQNIKGRRNPRKRKSRKFNRDPRTVRGRLAAKLSK